MILYELFDSKTTIKWKKITKVSWIGSFSIEGREYGIKFYTLEPGSTKSIIVDFYAKINDKLLYDPLKDHNKPFKVYANVISAISEYLAAVKPEKLNFTGDSNNGLARFYEKLIPYIAKVSNYTAETRKLPAMTLFVLKKPIPPVHI